MPFFHRIIILLYQSENTVVNIVFRHVETAGDSTRYVQGIKIMEMVESRANPAVSELLVFWVMLDFFFGPTTL
jgi:hypothetical protein